jgi:type II secretory ATPase GspE/PulE/Tfp pilus assembly ATPase PilB-like protein
LPTHFLGTKIARGNQQDRAEGDNGDGNRNDETADEIDTGDDEDDEEEQSSNNKAEEVEQSWDVARKLIIDELKNEASDIHVQILSLTATKNFLQPPLIDSMHRPCHAIGQGAAIRG